MTRFTYVLTGIALIIMVSPAMSQSIVPVSPGITQVPIPFGENLVVPVPADFKLGANGISGRFAQQEYISKSDSIEDWSVMITVSTIKGKVPISPDQYSKKIAHGFQSICAHATGKKLSDGDMNGFAYTQWEMSCDLNPMSGKPEFMISRSVQGQDSFYNIQYAFRAKPAPELEKQAIDYLNSVLICDTRLPDKPCKMS